jgi:predicted transcriptional regulator
MIAVQAFALANKPLWRHSGKRKVPPMPLTFARLSQMTAPERTAALDQLARAAKAKPNGHLDEQIRAFETQYEMSSADMLAAFRAGSVRDTTDISKWIMLLRVRERAAR